MSENTLLLPVIIPLIGALLIAVFRDKIKGLRQVVTFLATTAVLILGIQLFKQRLVYSLPWAGFGIDFTFRLYQFNAFILLAVSGFAFLITLYCMSFMRGKEHLSQFYAYLLVSVAMVNGAVLADNLILMLFFWEGLLLPLFGLIAIGGKEAFKTATKAVIIVGISDLCMMVGIGLVWYLTGTLTISQINMPASTLGSIAFILLMIGAISKAGSMPFHSWIPNAATDAQVPFMAFLPASLEKLLGIYLLARICLDMFKLNASSWLSIVLMTLGVITIILAVMMALIQKDYKKLLSYHAISQVGYMMLGIGTCLPIGIVGGIFHMINHALYKSCLFLTSGSVEKQAGTTNLRELGGLWRNMPITFICFFITAASISGVPPFNGFFSKEMVYAGALARNPIFYLGAILGSFFTAASFLKLGHSVYFGKRSRANENVKESKLAMLIPMIVIAGLCVFFGIDNKFPLKNFIEPVLSEPLHEEHANTVLFVLTGIVLLGAILHHLFATKVMGGGSFASDHIHHAPVIGDIYDRAEKGQFDPYNIVLWLVDKFSIILFKADRAVDWVYNGLIVNTADAFSTAVKKFNTGNYSFDIIWSLLGGIVLLIVMLMGLSS